MALTLMLSCASAKKPAYSIDPNIKKDNKENSKPVPATALPKAEKKSSRQDDSLDRVYPLIKKDKYNIVLLMPFYLNKEDLSKSEKNTSSISQDYYKGILSGIDSLKKCGANFNLYVMDNNRNWAGMNRLKDTLKSLDIDLVIGPLYEKELKNIVPFCNANKINIVSPFITLDTCFDKTYYMESNPGPESYGKAAGKLVKKSFKNSRVFLVNDKTTAANPAAVSFVDEKIGDSLHVIDYRGKGSVAYNGLKGFVDTNVIFIPSKAQNFLMGISGKIQLLDSLGYESTIIGMYTWLDLKSLEGDLWERHHLHLLVPFFADYSKPEVKSFVIKFREKFNEEPNEYEFRGFDDIMYYGTMISKYGKYFQREFPNAKMNTLNSNFSFERINNCSGYRNTNLHIIKFEDYEFKKVKQ